MMRHDTPLRNRHAAIARGLAPAAPVPGATRPGAASFDSARRAEAALEWIPYGPAPGDRGGRLLERPAPGPPAPGEEGSAGDGASACEIVATYGSVESEYAAIRRAAALLDAPHRATLRATGVDRTTFLNRMVTQELKDLAPGGCRSSFWLNRKGRIDADLLICATDDALWIDVDVHQAASTAASLGSFIFAEEVALVDDTARTHRLCVHGPEACAIVAAALDPSSGAPATVAAPRAGAPVSDAQPVDAARASPGAPRWSLEPGRVAMVRIAGASVVVARRDDTGEAGLHLFVPRDAVGEVWDRLASSAAGRVRPIGWHAFNIARIEAGTVLMNIDFDTSCLPHETGILHERVSFRKGCYLGQEVVARMESLGRPKQRLVGLRVQGDVLPVAGTHVHLREGEGPAAILGEPVGTITSSTISPMLGAAPIAFAMVRIAHTEPGRTLLVTGDGDRAEATVSPLRFWNPASRAAAAPGGETLPPSTATQPPESAA